MTSFDERMDKAVLNPLSGAMARVQEDLAELGVPLSLEGLEAEVAGFLKAWFAARDGDGDGDDAMPLAPHVHFGEGDQSAPPSLARSVAVFALRKLLSQWVDVLGTIERDADERTQRWVTQKLGKIQIGEGVVRVDFRQLVADVRAPQDADALLSVARQVLTWPTEKLAMLVSRVPHDANDITAFIRDLGQARLSDPKIEAMLVAMWNAEAVGPVVLIANELIEQQHPHRKPMVALAESIKKKLELPVAVQAAYAKIESPRVDEAIAAVVVA